MLQLIRDLYDHQAWADLTILGAIGAHAAAAADERLRRTLHHLLLTQRGFLSFFVHREMDWAQEARVPASLDEMEPVFRETHAEQRRFVSGLEPDGLSDKLELPFFQGFHPTVGEALLQVVMHSQWHRGQCAARLRELGGAPPTVDFILWAKNRLLV